MPIENIYFDTNAIDCVWDKFTTSHPEGDSNLDIKMTPFRQAIISVYAIDELLITLSETNNAFNAQKRGITFLSILKELPITMGVADILKTNANVNQNTIRQYVVPRGNIDGLIIELCLSFSTRKVTTSLQTIINDKKNARITAENQVNQTPYAKRVNFDTYLNDLKIKFSQDNLNDFMNICMEVYVALRDRKVKKPDELSRGDFFKNPQHALNQQIDCYHLCYAKYTDLFITNDKLLTWLIKQFKAKGLLSCRVMKPDDFFNAWLRSELTGQEIK